VDELGQGVTLTKAGKLDEAKAVFEEILLEDPKNGDVPYNLGMCFTDIGHPDKAITVLKKAYLL
jgi:tetratricopeptide (TPR) repeat protein